jgi:Family of unknown function (DUF6065)
MDRDTNQFVAYEIENLGIPISPAPIERAWMDTQVQAYRCLPMTIANQYGWIIHNALGATVSWNGDQSMDGVGIEFDDSPSVQDPRIQSVFGGGVISFLIPYLFRTPPSVNLWVKGPTNYIKDGAQPLEGIVETDWLTATFTMNWKLTRPNYAVRFERGEPICMIVPVARGYLERLEPIMVPLYANAELSQQYVQWTLSRAGFNAAVNSGLAGASVWEKHYTRGFMPGGASSPEHQTRLQLKGFGSVRTLPNKSPSQ